MLKAKVDRLAEKMDFVQNTPKNGLFERKINRHHLILGGAGGQTVDTRSPFGVPLKFFGYHCSKELCKKLVASKGTAAGRPFFLRMAYEFR